MAKLPPPAARRAAAPAARPSAAPARRAAPAPAVDDDFGDLDGGADNFEDFEEPADPPARGAGRRAPAPAVEDDFGDLDGGADAEGFEDFEEPAAPPARGARGAGRAAPAPAVEDDFGDFDADGVDGEASDDPDAADFVDGDGEGEEPIDEVPAEPKLRNGEYILVKGAKSWYVEGDDEGWKRSRTPVDTARNLNVSFSKKEHNYPVAGIEDKPGKATFVVLAYKRDYLIIARAEDLLDAKTKKPAKILAAAPVEEAPAPAARGRRAAAVEPEEVAPAMSREQVIAVRKFDAAVAELKAAFGIA